VEKIFVTLIGGGGGYSLSVEPGEVEVVEVEEERLSLTSQFRQHLVKH
jgi:DNA-binding IscR family transcriptional regulator